MMIFFLPRILYYFFFFAISTAYYVKKNTQTIFPRNFKQSAEPRHLVHLSVPKQRLLLEAKSKDANLSPTRLLYCRFRSRRCLRWSHWLEQHWKPADWCEHLCVCKNSCRHLPKWWNIYRESQRQQLCNVQTCPGPTSWHYCKPLYVG